MSEQLFKIMLAGDISTGKTSFISQLIYQTAQRNPKPTENLTFFALRLTNPNAIIQIWDSPGNARFKFQVFSILANFKALLLFVDVTNEFTLHKARTFIQQVQYYPALQIHLIESKVELTTKDPHKRKVSEQELNDLADSFGGLVFKYNRNEPIEPILQEILKKKKVKKENIVLKVSQSLQKIGTEEMSITACDCMIY